MYILLKIEEGRGGERMGGISGENNKARLPEMKRMSGVWVSERMTEKKRRPSLHFVALIIS